MNRFCRTCENLTALLFEKVLSFMLFNAGWKKRTVNANLDYVHVDDITDKEIFYRQLIKNLAHHASDIVFKFGSFKKLPHEIVQCPSQMDGTNYLIAPGSDSVLEKMRSGGIFLTAHYGNYETMGPWLCRLGIPLKASYIPLKPKWLNRIVENKIRAVDGKTYSVHARTPREFLQALKSQNLFCLLMDQDSRIPSAADGNFLGKPVHVNPLPEFLLRHEPGTPVFICWIEEDSHCKTLHAEEICSKNVNDSFNRWLETRIHENPALWYGWTHRRFYSTAKDVYP
jgi:KDO2-lipid IV(A) lauroyltransferase